MQLLPIPAQNSNQAPNPHLAQRRLGEAQGELLQFRQRRVQLHTFHGREAQVQASDSVCVAGILRRVPEQSWKRLGVSVDPGFVECVPTE